MKLLMQVLKYLDNNGYPDDATKNEKRYIRKRAKHFIIQDAMLYYLRTNEANSNP